MPIPTNTRKVVTGTVISISAKNIPLGRAQALRINESYGVRPVYEIGRMEPAELPVLQYSGAMSMSRYVLDLNENIILQFKHKGFGGITDTPKFVRQLLFAEGVDITISRIAPPAEGQTFDPIPNPEYRTFMNITGAICTGESISIEGNEVVMRQGEFLFREPLSVGV